MAEKEDVPSDRANPRFSTSTLATEAPHNKSKSRPVSRASRFQRTFSLSSLWTTEASTPLPDMSSFPVPPTHLSTGSSSPPSSSPTTNEKIDHARSPSAHTTASSKYTYTSHGEHFSREDLLTPEFIDLMLRNNGAGGPAWYNNDVFPEEPRPPPPTASLSGRIPLHISTTGHRDIPSDRSPVPYSPAVSVYAPLMPPASPRTIVPGRIERMDSLKVPPTPGSPAKPSNDSSNGGHSMTSRFSIDTMDARYSSHSSVGAVSKATNVNFSPKSQAFYARMSIPVPDGWKMWRKVEAPSATTTPSQQPKPSPSPAPAPSTSTSSSAPTPPPTTSIPPIPNFPPPPPRHWDPKGKRPSNRRKRVSSTRSGISRSSTLQSARRLGEILLRKPLPPTPSVRSGRTEDDGRPQSERLSALVMQAGTLSKILGRGSTQTVPRSVRGSADGFVDEKAISRKPTMRSMRSVFTSRSERSRRMRRGAGGVDGPPQPTIFSKIPESTYAASIRSMSRYFFASRTMFWILIIIVIIVVVVGSAIAVTTKSSHHNSATPSGSCPGNMTGSLCNLDATCACTWAMPGQCLPVAQALLNIAPTTSTLFNTTINADNLALTMYDLKGKPLSNCATQAIFLDTGNALNISDVSSTRAQWAQSAILYTLYWSQNQDQVNVMRTFISRLNFSESYIAAYPNAFQYSGSGYVYDFAKMTMAPAASISYQSTSSNKGWTVNGAQQPVLDRMYTYAAASSAQRTNALSSYWSSVLQKSASDLESFKTAILSAPVVIPFDATDKDIMAAYPKPGDTNTIFPPPLACIPGLNSKSLAAINLIETDVFGLSEVDSYRAFDPSCVGSRPIYGNLDVLRQRLPFPDTRNNTAQQAAVLSGDASLRSRLVIHIGESVQALPLNTDALVNISSSIDPRQYGTMAYLDHVILSYLQAVPNTLVTDLVTYVLSSPTVPPLSNTTLAQSLASIPTIEIAVLGGIHPTTDVYSFLSSLATPQSSLFFGSSQAQTFRSFALQYNTTSVFWTSLSAVEGVVVKESQTPDKDLEGVWSAAAGVISRAAAAGNGTDSVDVYNVASLLAAL